MTVHIVPTGPDYPTPLEVSDALNIVQQETSGSIVRWVIRQYDGEWVVRVVTT